MKEDEDLPIYTLYDHPLDYPKEYVIRRWIIKTGVPDPIPDKEVFYKSEKLSDCQRKMEEMGLIYLNRNKEDDPKIIGSFV